MEENEEFLDQIIDLRCRFMKYNLIFLGIYENDYENIEEVEFISVYRFGKKNKKRV